MLLTHYTPKSALLHPRIYIARCHNKHFTNTNVDIDQHRSLSHTFHTMYLIRAALPWYRVSPNPSPSSTHFSSTAVRLTLSQHWQSPADCRPIRTCAVKDRCSKEKVVTNGGNWCKLVKWFVGVFKWFCGVGDDWWILFCNFGIFIKVVKIFCCCYVLN